MKGIGSKALSAFRVAVLVVLTCVTGATAHAQLVPNTSTVNFGNQIVGTQSRNPQLVQIQNTSATASYTVASVSCSLSQFLNFVSGDFTVAPGGVLNVWIWFAPSSVQLYSGTLTFTTNENNTVQVELVGNGISAAQATAPAQGTLMVNTASVDFGSVSVGGSASRTATLSNSGAGTLTISNVTVSGAGLSIFGISSGQTLAPGQNVAVFLSYTPFVPGSVAGNVTIESDATNPQVQISLTGAGVSPSAQAQNQNQNQSQPVNLSVSLSWNPSSSEGVVGYNVYRSSISGGPYSLLTSSADTSTSYADASVSAGQTYYYVVTALNGTIESGYSNEISAAVP